MGWKSIKKRFFESDEKKINRKRNTLSSVGGRAADVSDRRINRLVTAGLVCIFAVLAGTVLWMALQKAGEELLFANPEYQLTRVDIVSDGQRVSPAKVKQWAEIEVGMNMHAVNIAKMRTALLRVPVIKSVDVTRYPPNRMEIRISERLPIACLGVHRLLGVDQTGFVFTVSPSRNAMPTITGFVEQISPGTRLQGRLLNAVEVVDVLNRTPLGGLIRVEVLDVRERDCLLMKLSEGPLVPLKWNDMAMSNPESRLALDGKLRSLARVLDDARMKNRRLAKIDMTYNDDYIPVE
jgi:cell division septal protein FtsQ